jgi:hypothetical protein
MEGLIVESSYLCQISKVDLLLPLYVLLIMVPLIKLYPFNFSVRSIHSIPFATVDVEEISGSQPAEVHNLGRYCNFSSMCY